VFLSAVFLTVSFASAQTQTKPTSELKDAQGQLRQIEEQRKASAAARQQLPAAENITFADVLKDPDNIDLNFRFAKAQVSRGDVKGAVGTLERILLVTPDLAPVRLFYAILLYRLDSLDEAEREFLSLSKTNVPAAMKTQIQQFLFDIVLRRKTTRYNVQLTVGGHFDSNRNSAPRTNQVEVGGILFNLVGDSQKRNDFASLAWLPANLFKIWECRRRTNCTCPRHISMTTNLLSTRTIHKWAVFPLARVYASKT
jgi:hypothetical protein